MDGMAWVPVLTSGMGSGLVSRSPALRRISEDTVVPPIAIPKREDRLHGLVNRVTVSSTLVGHHGTVAILIPIGASYIERRSFGRGFLVAWR